MRKNYDSRKVIPITKYSNTANHNNVASIAITLRSDAPDAGILYCHPANETDRQMDRRTDRNIALYPLLPYGGEGRWHSNLYCIMIDDMFSSRAISDAISDACVIGVRDGRKPVSYTHLTLPTILRV